MTYLTVPISAGSLNEARRQVRDALDAGAQILELRTDYLQPLRPEVVVDLIGEVRALSPAHARVLVTCRDPEEGGAGMHPEPRRIEILLAALEAGADFIDFEYANFIERGNDEKIRAALAEHSKSRLILSAHDFRGRFKNIRWGYEDIRNACPEAIPKLIYTANHINDCFEAFDLLCETDGDRIVLCMGEAGLISRILAKKLGGFLTFASLNEQAATAPGQLTIAALKRLYRYDSIGPETELFGVIADPVAHSLSPAIHNACFAEAGMNRLYLPLLVQGLESEFNAFLDNILERPWLDFGGFSVTIPHKHSALKYARQHRGSVEPLAEKIGAANTLVVARAVGRASSLAGDGRAGTHDLRERCLAAYNTDYAGALDAITDGMGIERKQLQDMPVAIVGAGGVARAIVAGLRDAGARVTIYNRTVERARTLAMEFGCEVADLDGLSWLDTKLLINGTSVGMHPEVNATPVPAERLRPDMAVFDTVYNPAETLLLKQAREKGAKTIDGVTMFVNQAAAQFHLFTRQEGDVDLMRRVVVDSL